MSLSREILFYIEYWRVKLLFFLKLFTHYKKRVIAFISLRTRKKMFSTLIVYVLSFVCLFVLMSLPHGAMG